MKEAFYFSHDYTARNDQKILTLRWDFWLEWYALYFMMLESMAEEWDWYIHRVAIGGLWVSYGVTKDLLLSFIEKCIEIWLFIEDEYWIFSKRMLEHKWYRKALSEQWKLGAEKKWETVRWKKAVFKTMSDFFNNTCVRCEWESWLLNVERDHIIPTYKWWKDDPTNWQPLCARCNSSKWPETIDHRIPFSKKHWLVMPIEWGGYDVAITKERKGKEIKEKESKTETDISKDIWSTDLALEWEKEYWNKEINQILLLLKQTVWCDDFKESQQWQRRYWKHFLNLWSKIWNDEFWKRLQWILSDKFKSKNCNSLKYLYDQMKSYIHSPIISNIPKVW